MVSRPFWTFLRASNQSLDSSVETGCQSGVDRDRVNGHGRGPWLQVEQYAAVERHLLRYHSEEEW